MSSDDNTIIKVDSISKTFRLPHEKTTSIKGSIVNFWNKDRTYEKQLALNNVSFEVKKGEFFGIVGRNGSGKSTLLKLLAGIYAPSNGLIHVNGKLTPFIELGVGFNPELTGRENVFLNGALLGFDRKEMAKMYDDIVRFAEIGRFMDQKLKNYSSGMQVRLAFSIAIRAKSDILLLDEVLAVGDEAFQQKCIDVFESYKANKQTIVLVTHDMEIVRRFCTRAMLLDSGQIIDIGEPTKVAGKYNRLNEQLIDESINKSNSDKETDSTRINLRLNNQSESSVVRYRPDDLLEAELSWPKDIKSVKNVGVAIVKKSGESVFGANTFANPPKKLGNKITYKVKLKIGPGKYFLMAGLFGKSEQQVIEFLKEGPEFIVTRDAKDTLNGIARLPYEWQASNMAKKD